MKSPKDVQIEVLKSQARQLRARIKKLKLQLELSGREAEAAERRAAIAERPQRKSNEHRVSIEVARAEQRQLDFCDRELRLSDEHHCFIRDLLELKRTPWLLKQSHIRSLIKLHKRSAEIHGTQAEKFKPPAIDAPASRPSRVESILTAPDFGSSPPADGSLAGF